MTFYEQPLSFCCHDCWLYGILSTPVQPSSRGVLIVVGGPQYRVGSHRQFTLLARSLADNDIPTLRFDYRGMGDSDGAIRTFETIEDDLKSAIDQFFINVPSLKEVLIWGLCDAASAALFYAHKDHRIAGLILVNPWVRTELGTAKVYLKHYYFSRLLQLDFWKKIVTGQFKFSNSFNFIAELIRKLITKEPRATSTKEFLATDLTTQSLQQGCELASLPDRMLDGLRQFTGKIFVITSGNDLTAKEFLDLINGMPDWKQTLKSKQVTFAHLKTRIILSLLESGVIKLLLGQLSGLNHGKACVNDCIPFSTFARE